MGESPPDAPLLIEPNSPETNDFQARRLAALLLRDMSLPMTKDTETDCAVLSYLEAHPHAADTLEGIVDWWLERRRIHDAVEIVTAAVGRLIDRGIVEEFRRSDHAPLFRLTNSQP